MNETLRQREVFHLTFLSWLVRSVPPACVVLKGGTNLRFFFDSPRYSEDMDLDAADVSVDVLRDKVMYILSHRELRASLGKQGIDDIIPPDLRHAKQTETVQRFKIHLLTRSGLDLFTKIEFSRRGFEEGVMAEPLSAELSRQYHLMPFIIPHYEAAAAVRQKVKALAGRAKPQARDVFDLFLLLSHIPADVLTHVSSKMRAQAIERIFMFDYTSFTGGVVEFLSDDDRMYYGTPDMWETIQLRVSQALEAAHGSR